MRDTDAKLVVHRLANSAFDLKVRTSVKSIEALDAGSTVPGAKSKVIQVVDPVRNTQPSNQRFKSDAPGYDDGRGTIAELLKRTTQPTQKLVNLFVSVVVMEHPFQEDRQFINDKQDRLIVFGTVTNQLFTKSSPVAFIQLRPETHSKLPGPYVLDSVRQPIQQAERPRGEPRFHGSNWICGLCNICNQVLRTGGTFDICEEKHPSLGFEAKAQFPCNTGFTHTTLAGQQHVVSIPHTLI